MKRSRASSGIASSHADAPVIVLSDDDSDGAERAHGPSVSPIDENVNNDALGNAVVTSRDLSGEDEDEAVTPQGKRARLPLVAARSTDAPAQLSSAPVAYGPNHLFPALPPPSPPLPLHLTSAASHPPLRLPDWRSVCDRVLAWQRPDALLLAALDRDAALYPDPYWACSDLAIPAMVDADSVPTAAIARADSAAAGATTPAASVRLERLPSSELFPPPLDGAPVPAAVRAYLPPRFLRLVNTLWALDCAGADALLQHTSGPTTSVTAPASTAAANTAHVVASVPAPAAAAAGYGRASMHFSALQRDAADRFRHTITVRDVVALLTVMPEAYVLTLTPAGVAAAAADDEAPLTDGASSTGAGIGADRKQRFPHERTILLTPWLPLRPSVVAASVDSTDAGRRALHALPAGSPGGVLPPREAWTYLTGARRARCALLVRRLLYLALLAQLAPLRALVSGAAHGPVAGPAFATVSTSAPGAGLLLAARRATATAIAAPLFGSGFGLSAALTKPLVASPPACSFTVTAGADRAVYPKRNARSVTVARALWPQTLAALAALAPTLGGPPGGVEARVYARVHACLLATLDPSATLSTAAVSPSAVFPATAQLAGTETVARALAGLWDALPTPTPVLASAPAHSLRQAHDMSWLPEPHYVIAPSLVRDGKQAEVPLPPLLPPLQPGFISAAAAAASTSASATAGAGLKSGAGVPVMSHQPLPLRLARATAGAVATAAATADAAAAPAAASSFTRPTADPGGLLLPPVHPAPSVALAISLLDDCVFPPVLTVTGLRSVAAAAASAAAATGTTLLAATGDGASSHSAVSSAGAAASADTVLTTEACAALATRARLPPAPGTTAAAIAALARGCPHPSTLTLPPQLPTSAASAPTAVAAVTLPLHAFAYASGPAAAAATADALAAHVQGTQSASVAASVRALAAAAWPGVHAGSFFGPVARHSARLLAALLHPLRGLVRCAPGDGSAAAEADVEAHEAAGHVMLDSLLPRVATAEAARLWASDAGSGTGGGTGASVASSMTVLITKTALRDALASLRGSSVVAQLERKIGVLGVMRDAAEVIRGLALGQHGTAAATATSAPGAPAAAPSPSAGVNGAKSAVATAMEAARARLAQLRKPTLGAARSTAAPMPAAAQRSVTTRQQGGPSDATAQPQFKYLYPSVSSVVQTLSSHHRLQAVHGLTKGGGEWLLAAMCAVAVAAAPEVTPAEGSTATTPGDTLDGLRSASQSELIFSYARTGLGTAVRFNALAPLSAFAAAADATSAAICAQLDALRVAFDRLDAAAARWLWSSTAASTGAMTATPLIEAACAAPTAAAVVRALAWSLPAPEAGDSDESGFSRDFMTLYRTTLLAATPVASALPANAALVSDSTPLPWPTAASDRLIALADADAAAEECFVATARTLLSTTEACSGPDKVACRGAVRSALSRFAGCARGRLYFLPACAGLSSVPIRDGAHPGAATTADSDAPALCALGAAGVGAGGAVPDPEGCALAAHAHRTLQGGAWAEACETRLPAVVEWLLRCVVVESAGCDMVVPDNVAAYVCTAVNASRGETGVPAATA